MKKNLVAAMTVLALAGALSACSVSSSSSSHASFTTSYTDENGETKEKTYSVGYDAGIGDTKEAEAEEEQDDFAAEEDTAQEAETAGDPSEATDEEIAEERRQFYFDTYEYGCEGFNADGDAFFFAFDNIDDVQEAALIILSNTNPAESVYVIGDVEGEGEGMRILDDFDENLSLFYIVEDASGDNDFDLRFKDGDVAQMSYVDLEVIVEDMNRLIDMARENGEFPLAGDVLGGEEKAQGVWTVRCNPDLFDVTEEDGTTTFVYTGESAGTNQVSITFFEGEDYEDVLADKTADWDEEETATVNGEYTETGKNFISSECALDEEGARANVTVIQCNEGTLCLETLTHASGDDEIDIPVSDALSSIFDSLEINE